MAPFCLCDPTPVNMHQGHLHSPACCLRQHRRSVSKCPAANCEYCHNSLSPIWCTGIERYIAASTGIARCIAASASWSPEATLTKALYGLLSFYTNIRSSELSVSMSSGHKNAFAPATVVSIQQQQQQWSTHISPETIFAKHLSRWKLALNLVEY